MKTLNELSELTQDGIADLYFQSLGNPKTRGSHVLLKPKITEAAVPTPEPSVHDIEMDFTSWYGGLLSLANGIDPGIDLPTPRAMASVIIKGFERAKAALAA
jgi:hypothetical protein